MNMPKIDGKEIVPVRLIPFVTGWGFSPDVVVKMLSKQDLWHRVFIPSYHILPNGTYYEMLPKEWDVFISDMEILSDKLNHAEQVEGENYPIWRKQSIETIPAGTFVWLDELEKAYKKAYSFIVSKKDRPGDDKLNHHAFVPVDMRELVCEGFDIEQPTNNEDLDVVQEQDTAEFDQAFQEFSVDLPRLLAELAELMAIQPETMEARKHKKTEIADIQKQIDAIKSPDKIIDETPAERKKRLEEWFDKESLRGDRGALQRTAKREGISRQALREILDRHD